MNPLTSAIFALDWWTDRLAVLPAGTVEHTEAQARYEYWYERAAELQTRQDERDYADTWLEYGTETCS